MPETVKFVSDYRAATKKTPSARDWFGYVSVHSVQLAAEKAKSLEGPKMAAAMEDLELPPDVALQPGTVLYREGDHELMANIFVGEAHPLKAAPTIISVAIWCRANKLPVRLPIPAARWCNRAEHPDSPRNPQA